MPEVATIDHFPVVGVREGQSDGCPAHGRSDSLSAVRIGRMLHVFTTHNHCLRFRARTTVLLLAACGGREPSPGTVRRRGDARGADRSQLPGCRRRLLPRHGRRPDADEGADPGAQHVDRLDRRQRPALGRALGRESLGSLDFLKTLSSHPTLPYSRDTRWNYLGLVNEPCFRKATGPDPNRYGLWLDVRDPACRARSVRQRRQVQGRPDRRPRQDRRRSARTTASPRASSACGCSRIPDFDEEARKKWDSERYYRDPSYYESRDLVKPYRVGMSCAFCHVGPNPVKPPADPENPRWENLSSNVGAQFFWWDRVFDWKATTNAGELPLPVAAHVAAGHARHVARLDRTTSTTRGR